MENTKQEILELFGVTDVQQLSIKIKNYSLGKLMNKHEEAYHTYYTPLGWELRNIYITLYTLTYLLDEIEKYEKTSSNQLVN